MRERLQALLDYWVKHNREHIEEIKEWREKLREDREVAELLARSIERMEEANLLLEEALRKLR